MATAQDIALALKSGAPFQGFGNLAGWNAQFPLKDYQQRGVMWLYFTVRALLMDTMGSGKTAHALALIQMLLARGECSRVLVVVKADTVYGSWINDGFRKFVPDMPWALAGTGMTKAKRRKVYADQTWRVLLTNYETFWRDEDDLLALGFDVIICDEADVLRNQKNKAHQTMRRLARHAHRVLLMTATPLNNRLADLYGLLCILGLEYLVGDEDQFKRSYIDVVFDYVWVTSQGRRMKKPIPRVVGHKNLDHLKAVMYPFYLRRTRKDIPAADMPFLEALEKWIELSPAQVKVYNQLLHDAYTLEDGGREALYLRLRQCCTSTALIDPAHGDHSSKMDFLIERSIGEWQDEKIVVFSNWRDSLALFAKRLDVVGHKHVTFTSDIDQRTREDYRQHFLHDPEYKYLLGTTAIEKGHNFQVSRLQVNLDPLPNPQRHDQIAGRIVRSGSAYDMAYALSLFSLLPGGHPTVELDVLRLLAKKAALAGYMWEDATALQQAYIDTLSEMEWRQVVGLK